MISEIIKYYEAILPHAKVLKIRIKLGKKGA